MLALLSLALLAAGPGAGPRLDWSLPAGLAVATDDAIVLWAPDFRSLLGVDASGKRLWRVATGDQGGYRDLERWGDSVLAYAGTEALLVDARSGHVQGRAPDVRLGSPGVPGCRIERHAGACAVSCPCSLRPLRCEDLAPAAPPMALASIEEWDPDGGRTSTCIGSPGGVVGRAGGTLVAVVAGSVDPKSPAVASELAGYDVKRAAVLWHVPSLGAVEASDVDLQRSGALGDGHTCWVTSRAGRLRVFDCQRAATRWSRDLAWPAGTEPQIEPVADGLVVRDGARVLRLAAADGRVVWDVAVDVKRVFVLAGSAERQERRFDRRAGLTVLDPATGASRGELAFSAGATRWPLPWPASDASAGGWVALGDKDFAVLLSGRDKPVAGQATAFIEDLVPGAALLALRTREGISVRGLEDSFATRVEGQLVVAVEGVVGAGRVLSFVQGKGPWDPKDPKTFGELRRYTLR